MCYVLYDLWYMICDMWYVIYDIWCMIYVYCELCHPCPGYGLLAVKSTVTRLVVLQTLNLSDDGFAAGSACLLVSGEVLRQRCVGLTGFTHAANWYACYLYTSPTFLWHIIYIYSICHHRVDTPWPISIGYRPQQEGMTNKMLYSSPIHIVARPELVDCLFPVRVANLMGRDSPHRETYRLLRTLYTHYMLWG